MNVPDIIRELMEIQQLSIRKVSALIAEKQGGSIYGYTQQISRILNDPNYDPSLSTVQKIFSVLNVSFWELSRTSLKDKEVNVEHLAARLDQLSADVVELKLGLAELQEAVGAIAKLLQP